MTDLQGLFTVVDQLSPQELIQLREYVEHKAQTVVFAMSEAQLEAIDEIFRPTREAVKEVRDERTKLIS